MNTRLGDLLLTLGTVLGGIAAANSQQAGRALALDRDAYPGEYLLHPATGLDPDAPPAPPEPEPAGPGAEPEARADARTVVADAGTELTAEVVAELRAAGFERVQVRVPAQPVEIVAGDAPDALLGRVLADDVVLSREPRRLEAGDLLRHVDLREMRAAGIETLRLLDRDGSVVDEPIGDRGTFELVSRELAETVAFDYPVQVPAGTFLTPERVEEVVAAGQEQVELRVPSEFRFDRWDLSWMFGLGVFLMLGGVVVKRGAARAAVVTQEQGGAFDFRPRFDELVAAIDRLATAPDASAEAIHDAIDPLLTDVCYPLVEERQQVADRHGHAVYIDVMGPFASAERWLNRAWSSSADGVVEEARDCLTKAAEQLHQARSAFPSPT